MNKTRQCSSPFFEIEFPSVRKFTVSQPGEYSICVKQRDRRFFHFKEHDYIWIRAILLQQEYEDAGYRWHSGEYARKKALNFTQFLEIGEYWLFVEPEWPGEGAHELVLQVHGLGEVELLR